MKATMQSFVRIFFVSFFCFFAHFTFAQSVAINTDGTTADASAILDVKSTTKGMLIPRMTTSQRTAVANPATGLLVFDTDANAFWFYNGTAWIKLESAGSNWSVTGNGGTTAGTNFLGTTDANDLVFKTNNNEQLRLLNTVSSTNQIATLSGGDLLINNITAGTGTANIPYNTVFGYQGLYSNGNNGRYNTAVGYQALYSNTTGTYNHAIGYQSLYLNTTGRNNIGLGSQTLYSNTTGLGNVAIGYQSLNANLNGSLNVAVGQSTLLVNQGGTFNVALGSNALNKNNAGADNTALGAVTLTTNVNGNSLTGVGYGADVSADGLSNATAIGYGAIVNAGNKVVIGNTAVTVIGGQVAWSTLSDGRFKTNIKEDVPGLDFIMQLRPVNYNFNPKKFEEHLYQRMPDNIKQASVRKAVDYSEAEKILHTGFIAQEVEQVVKKNGYKFNAVHAPTNETDNYSIAYDEFVVPLVKAVQQQQKQMQDLQKIISQQQQLLEAMQKQLDKLQHQ